MNKIDNTGFFNGLTGRIVDISGDLDIIMISEVAPIMSSVELDYIMSNFKRKLTIPVEFTNDLLAQVGEETATNMMFEFIIESVEESISNSLFHLDSLSIDRIDQRIDNIRRFRVELDCLIMKR